MSITLKAPSGWRFVLHAGCAETCPDAKRQSDISQNLDAIASVVANALMHGANAKDAVVLAVSALEDCPVFNAGIGAALNLNGIHQLEAGIADGRTTSYGAVGCVEKTKNPILLASALLEQGPHAMLVGQAADKMAKERGLDAVDNSHFTTPFRKTHWERVTQSGEGGPDTQMGTVGAIVLDSQGQLAAGGSTGGPTGKMHGRIGDTAILGAGLYADARLSILCSGAGDQIFRQLLAANVAKYHALGSSLRDAARQALRSISNTGASCAVAAIDADGNTVIESTARLFSVAWGSASTSPMTSLHPTTFPIVPSHEISNDGRFAIGLSRYLTTVGHTLVILQRDVDLFSLQAGDFVDLQAKISQTASILCKYYKVRRCALVTDGGSSLSLLPLHGLSTDWKPVTCDQTEFHETFPGYVSSKDGPPMDASRLDEVCSNIRMISGLSSPFNYRFDGAAGDSNLFARIVRGELQQWRIWEDDHHVAFLTPFPNTPGFTVVVPRSRLSSDIFSLDKEPYSKLMVAAHTTAEILKTSFGIRQCGMIFEGFAVDYAHVKLVPINKAEPSHSGTSVGNSMRSVAPVQETYQGYVSSLEGPLFKDFKALANAAHEISKMVPTETISPPRSWNSPSQHLLSVLQEPWYENLFMLQDILFHTSVSFFQKSLGYKYCFVPATTDAVSSPMGLGSDSEPVSIDFLGRTTHLADSMQFSLEYFLRIKNDLPGVYYINTSFRGEDPDAMHLNQFYHIECELLGAFAKGVSVAEAYIINLISSLLHEQNDLIRNSVGNTDHLKALLKLYSINGDSFPRISVDDAILLPNIDSSCWKYVIPSDPSKGRTFTRAGELKLIAHFGGAVWLTEMDHLSVPFYQAFKDEHRAKARCADLLLGNGEVLGLGERHVSADDVLTALRQHEIPAEGYTWYTEIRNRKPILTTGWGMGIERFLAWTFQHDDIRDLTVVPRMKGLSFAP
ncbi:MAG: hypothetical protein M1821_007411 [Bathelium mastoideum]|nr:MAG: hypothetical protein M1821_007411 [Bathelium mastoideum]